MSICFGMGCNMLDHYINWYKYSLEALDYVVENIIDLGYAERIVVTGLGGSGIVGDLLASIASDYSNVVVHVYKDFYIPKTVLRKDSVVLAISYSGNTLETVSSTLKALDKGSKVCVVTSGGRLLDIAKRRSLPYVVVRGDLVPRLAMPIMFIASLKLLSRCGIEIVPMDVALSSINVLKDTENAKEIAREIIDYVSSSQIITVVATSRFQALAYRIKDEFNENSKIPVKVEIAPELFHNDIVGWENAKVRDVAILIDSDILYENKLISFYNEYLKSIGLRTYILKLRGNIIERHLYGSLIAGIASVYLAQIRGLNPVETKSIAMYKSRVKELEKEFIVSNTSSSV
ncbi:MAG: bifunctional phosphoglucose/phosphomannose isomerase [Ignisphaera sp.]